MARHRHQKAIVLQTIGVTGWRLTEFVQSTRFWLREIDCILVSKELDFCPVNSGRTISFVAFFGFCRQPWWCIWGRLVVHSKKSVLK